MRFAALCGFTAEQRLAQRFGLTAFATGGDASRGRALAARAAETADGLISFGIAGGLAPGPGVGELLALETVVATPQAKAAHHARHGAIAVDLESLPAARAAQAARKPFAVLRAIADPADRGLPPAALVGLHPSGRPAPGRVLAALIRQPGQIPDVMTTARDTRRALSSLRAALAALREIL